MSDADAAPPKAKKPAKKADHPPVAPMVNAAIAALKKPAPKKPAAKKSPKKAAKKPATKKAKTPKKERKADKSAAATP